MRAQRAPSLPHSARQGGAALPRAWPWRPLLTHASVALLVMYGCRGPFQRGAAAGGGGAEQLLRGLAAAPCPRCEPATSCPPPPPPPPDPSACPPPPAAAAAALPEPTPHPDPWRTQQVCYQQPDDSEYCTYEGPICYRGLNEGLVVLSDELAGMGLKSADSRPSCMDGRDYSAADGCSYGANGKVRAWQPPPAALSDVRDHYFALPSLPTLGLPDSWPTSMARDAAVRRWGPTSSGLDVGHVPPAWVANVTSDAQLAALGAAFAAHVAGARGSGEPAGLAALHANFRPDVLVSPPERVTWLPGNAVFARLTHDSFSHPYHAFVALAQLWGLKRANASVADARAAAARVGKPLSPMYNYTVGALPGGGLVAPIDHLVLTSTHMAVHNVSVLPPWTAALLALLTQRDTRFLLPHDYTHGSGSAGGADGGRLDPVNATHWLCAPRGLVLGQRDRVFAGPGDAHAFRLAAYAAANVTARAWATHPPRTITLLVRERWRQFTNHAEVHALLAATGLPVRVERSLGKLSFDAQVALFAGTGILVSAHGAALINAIFMPKGAVVVEVAPYLGVTPLYARISEQARVRHLTVYSDAPSNASLHSGLEGMAELYGSERFAAECERPRLSSTDAPLQPFCNLASKRAQIEVSLEQLRAALRTALDDIGCRDSVCRVPNSPDTVDMLPHRAGNNTGGVAA